MPEQNNTQSTAPVTLDMSTFQPLDKGSANSSNNSAAPVTLDLSTFQPLEENKQQPDHSFMQDLTGSTLDQWEQWGKERQEQFLKHPISQSLSSLGHFIWGGVKAADEMSPISIQKLHDEIVQTKENYDAYQAARKQGHSVKESMQIAGQASAKSNPAQLFKAPDINDSTESALYDAVSAEHGEGAGRLALAFKRVLRSAAEEFKRDPDEMAGNMAVKMLPVILTAGAATPQAAAGEPEGALSTAANEAKVLSRLKEPSIVKKLMYPEDTAKTSGAIKGESAIRESTGVTDSAVPVRRSFGNLADDLKTQAKPVYQKMDELTGGKWDANRNAIEDTETALRREADADKLGKLRTKKADLLNERQQLQDEATKKGVSADDIKSANTNWRRASALDKLEQTFKSSVDAEDRVDLASAIKKLKNFDLLDDAMGGKESSTRLISRLEDEFRHQQAMQAKYTAAKYVGGATAGLIGAKAFWSLVSSLLGK